MGISMRRGSDGGSGGHLADASDDPEFSQSHPCLFAFLVAETWETGEKRATGTLLVFVDDGKWKACLSDRDGGRVAFVSASTAKGLLDASEAGLDAGTLDWRRKTANPPGRPRRP